MRRKVIQHFANTFCQRLIDLPEGYDLATFVHFGSGLYRANILNGECTHNNRSIPSLRLCDVYSEWLKQQSHKHNVQYEGFKLAVLEMQIRVSHANTLGSFGHRFASAHFAFDCRSEIETDEKAYVGKLSGEKDWGFDWYYERLYGKLPDSWPDE